MFVTYISALRKNYIWILYDSNRNCIIVDPGVSTPIIKEIKKKKWNPIAILLTHYHLDHVGGVEKIKKEYPNISVFGPDETKQFNTQTIQGGGSIQILQKKINTFFTPGHTFGHISFYLKPYLFCGDVLFSGGCGRVYQKKYFDMYKSIQLINSFPGKTILCCGHDYTLSNLDFARFMLPCDKKINKHFKKLKNNSKYKKNFPIFLFNERKINIFLRTKDIFLKSFLQLNNKSSFEVFLYLRLRKDIF